MYEQLGVKPPAGVLLHGPPGTGKTALARAACGQLEIEMIDINTSELISDRSGGSEKNIRDLFETAEVGIAMTLLIFYIYDNLAKYILSTFSVIPTIELGTMCYIFG